METSEKAKIRIEHWIHHNNHHIEDYELFADELEEAGQKESAGYIREMISLTLRSTELLNKALKALGDE